MAEVGEGQLPILKCSCMICQHTWYFQGVPESRVRASCSPCGHQGLFDVEEVDEMPSQDVTTHTCLRCKRPLKIGEVRAFSHEDLVNGDFVYCPECFEIVMAEQMEAGILNDNT